MWKLKLTKLVSKLIPFGFADLVYFLIILSLIGEGVLFLNTIYSFPTVRAQEIEYKTPNTALSVYMSLELPEIQKKRNAKERVAEKKRSQEKVANIETKRVSAVEFVKTSREKIQENPNASVDSLIDKYASQHGVDPVVMKKIAFCESGKRPEAVNGPYAGIFQFVSSTWISNRRAMGEDPNPELRFNAEEAIKTAAFKMSRDGFGAWPVCGRKALSSI